MAQKVHSPVLIFYSPVLDSQSSLKFSQFSLQFFTVQSSIHSPVFRILAVQSSNFWQSSLQKFWQSSLQNFGSPVFSVKLSQFLRFTTTSDVLLSSKIEISFTKLEGASSRPIAHTCGPLLELPSTYSNFVELWKEFHNILSKDSWEMDIMWIAVTGFLFGHKRFTLFTIPILRYVFFITFTD